MKGEWRSTGSVQHIGNIDKIPPYDPRSGNHLWIFTGAWKWGGPDVETPMLDMESLLIVAGPGCFYCEQEYTPLIATRRCKGEPKNGD